MNEDLNSYFTAQGSVLPDRLPAQIDLMVYGEIHPIVSREILKCYWRKGGTYKSLHYGDPDFKADFWPESWQWETVGKNFANMKKEDYRGPFNLNLTEFFRCILKQIFEYYSINPDKYISKDFTERKRRNRERYRGIHRAPIVVERDNNHGVVDNEPEEVGSGDVNDDDVISRDTDSVRTASADVDSNDEREERNGNSRLSENLDDLLSRDTDLVRTDSADVDSNDETEEGNDNYMDTDSVGTGSANGYSVGDISDLLSREVLDVIEEEVGFADVLEAEITTEDIMSPLHRSPVYSRKRKQNNEN